MYYYIMEPTGKKDLALQEKIKDLLGDMGIAGETVTPTPARTIEELTHLGIIKGYSTIVVVGSEKTANTVATTIVQDKENKDIVLGVIPENYESLIAKEIGVTDLKSAVNALKFRKLKTVDLGMIDPNKYFLTEAYLESDKSIEAYFSTAQIKAAIIFNQIIIRPGLEIEIKDYTQKKKTKQFLKWFFGVKKEENDIFSSFFKAKKVKIETINTVIPVKVGGEVISKTPIICSTKPQALKIIVARDTIETKE